MNIRKKWLLTVSRTDSDKVLKLSFSQRSIVFLFGVLVIVIAILSLSVLYVNRHSDRLQEIPRLEEENRKLKTHIGSLAADMDSINADIRTMKTLEDSLRPDNNLRELYDEIRDTH